MPLPLIEPMLATNRVPARPCEWAVEPKLDGWRALVYVDGEVRVRTRSGRDVTASVPGLAGLGGFDHQVILDGELVADAGRASDFYRLGPRLRSRRPRGPVSFAAFDVLCLDGELLTNRPYRDRRVILEKLELGGGCCTLPSFTADLRDVFDSCAELGLEGVVAKRLDSRYQPGKRSADWVKIKTVDWKSQHGPLRHE